MASTKKQPDNKGNSVIGERNKRVLYSFMVLLTLIFLLIVYLLLPDKLGYDKGVSPQERQTKTLEKKIESYQNDLAEEQKEFSKLLNDYYQKTGEKLPELTAFGLTNSQKKNLEERMKSKKSFSTKALLSEILEKNNEISKISVLIKKYQDLLPQSRIVKKGDNHYEIAMNFLRSKKGITKEKSSLLVSRSSLFDSLRPGFKVWNYYTGDEYGTFVTQGEADISPTELMRQKREKLKEEQKKELDKLSAIIDDLKLKESEANSEVKNLQNKNLELEKKIKDLSNKILNLNLIVNTLSYELDSKKNLVKEGMIKKRFLRRPKLIDTSSDSYKEGVDLRVEKTIMISAKDFDLRKIKRITLYPKFYKENIDYKVKIIDNKQKAVITILSVDKFKTERVVISVE